MTCRWSAPDRPIHRNDIVSKTPSTAPTAFKRSSSLKTTLAYMGSNMSLFAKGEETGGRFALMEFYSRPGNEPPPHIHEWEHELYYLLEGRMDFYCDNEILSIGAGEVAFLPQGKAHAFYIRSPIVRALISVQATGERAVGLDRYFIDRRTGSEPGIAGPSNYSRHVRPCTFHPGRGRPWNQNPVARRDCGTAAPLSRLRD
jgi:mannose-6-phosphate isomerase-like protein (cupin superfamily)